MAKKTKEELVAEGKALATEIQAVKTKGPLNCALFLSEDGVVALFDKVKGLDALRVLAKKDGATAKGAVGLASCEGKIITLACAEGETPPPKLGKAFKKHMKERGLSFKVLIADATGKVTEADEEDAPGAEPVDAKDGTNVPKPGAPPNPDDGLKDKLEKAFEKVRPHLVSALKDAPVDYQNKLKTPALAYATAMKAADYETALAELTKLRAAIVKAPTVDRLITALTDKTDPDKLSKMKDLLDGVMKRAKTEKDFDTKARPLMKEMRGALKVALNAKPPPTGEQLKALETMKKDLDNTFLDYLKQEGHGPQRHEGGVTKAQLSDRVMRKFDPMTGTTSDGAKPGTVHKCGKDACRITDPGVYVDADDHVRSSPVFADEVKILSGKGQIKVVLPIADVLGAEYKKFVEGQTNTGSNRHPAGPADTDFTDGTVVAIYSIEDDGSVELLTMYPDPK